MIDRVITSIFHRRKLRLNEAQLIISSIARIQVYVALEPMFLLYCSVAPWCIFRWDGAYLHCINQIKESTRWVFEIITACPLPQLQSIVFVVNRTRFWWGLHREPTTPVTALTVKYFIISLISLSRAPYHQPSHFPSYSPCCSPSFLSESSFNPFCCKTQSPLR